MYDLFSSMEVMSGHPYTNLIYINWNLYRNISLNDCMASPNLITLNVSCSSVQTHRKQILYCGLTLCYKMSYSHSTLVFTHYFIINNSNMRQNNNYKIKKQPSKIYVRSHFFTNRVIWAWNTLSEVIVTALSLSLFKSHLKQLQTSIE